MTAGTGPVIYGNAAFQRLTGYGPDLSHNFVFDVSFSIRFLRIPIILNRSLPLELLLILSTTS